MAKKQIMNVEIKAEVDAYPDLSYLGEYSNNRRKFAIDRQIRHDQERDQYQYFIPANLPQSGMTQKERRESWNMCELAYERMEGYNNGRWQMMGIRAIAEINVGGTIQRITSGGLWGIESDCGQDYLDMIEAEQKEELVQILRGLGFSKRQILKAM